MHVRREYQMVGAKLKNKIWLWSWLLVRWLILSTIFKFMREPGEATNIWVCAIGIEAYGGEVGGIARNAWGTGLSHVMFSHSERGTLQAKLPAETWKSPGRSKLSDRLSSFDQIHLKQETRSHRLVKHEFSKLWPEYMTLNRSWGPSSFGRSTSSATQSSYVVKESTKDRMLRSNYRMLLWR